MECPFCGKRMRIDGALSFPCRYVCDKCSCTAHVDNHGKVKWEDKNEKAFSPPQKMFNNRD